MYEANWPLPSRTAREFYFQSCALRWEETRLGNAISPVTSRVVLHGRDSSQVARVGCEWWRHR